MYYTKTSSLIKTVKFKRLDGLSVQIFREYDRVASCLAILVQLVLCSSFFGFRNVQRNNRVSTLPSLWFSFITLGKLLFVLIRCFSSESFTAAKNKTLKAWRFLHVLFSMPIVLCQRKGIRKWKRIREGWRRKDGQIQARWRAKGFLGSFSLQALRSGSMGEKASKGSARRSQWLLVRDRQKTGSSLVKYRSAPLHESPPVEATRSRLLENIV